MPVNAANRPTAKVVFFMISPGKFLTRMVLGWEIELPEF
jgi:hypothetical protein